MTWWKIAVAWWLIGAVVQIVMMLRLRQKYGRYIADVSWRIVLGRFALLKTFTSCFFWPLGIYVWFRGPLLTPKTQAQVIEIADYMKDKCLDCGEPLTSHEDLSQ